MSDRIKILFPPGVNHELLKITKEGEFSVTFWRDAQQVCDVIKKYVGSDITITDATACNGGDTIMFAKNFKHVNSVEYNEKNYEVLANNVNVYNLKNVTLYNNDYNDCLDLKQTVLYFDPPWGGPEYKNRDLIDTLHIGTRKIEDFVELPELKNVKLFVFKLPKNYNTYKFKQLGAQVVGVLNKRKDIKYIMVYLYR